MDYKKASIELAKKYFPDCLKNRLNWRERIFDFIKNEKKQICVFGTGAGGRHAWEILKNHGMHVDFFCDNNPKVWNQEVLQNIWCYSMEKLVENKENTVVFIGSIQASKEIFQQLQSNDFPYILDGKNFFMCDDLNDLIDMSRAEFVQKIEDLINILDDEESKKVVYGKLLDLCTFNPYLFNEAYYYHDYMIHDQYFCGEIVENISQDIFVDCGAFNGDTLDDIVQRKLKFKKYIGYELNRKNYNELKQKISVYQSGNLSTTFLAYNLGVGSKEESFMYNEDSASATKASQTGNVEGRIIPLDSLKERASYFVKMDIEGAERDALIGAKELIRNQQPKLSICVYHQFSDLWEIPFYIKSLVPAYKIYLRHHTIAYIETVCYAI